MYFVVFEAGFGHHNRFFRVGFQTFREGLAKIRPQKWKKDPLLARINGFLE